MAYMTFVATTGSYAYIGDDAAFDPSGDVEWRFDIAPADWTPEAYQRIIDRYEAGVDSADRQYRISFGISATQQEIWITLEDGAGGWRGDYGPNITSATFSPGQRVQIRITLDADNGSGNTDIYLYTRTGANIADLASNTGWTQEGDPYDNIPGTQTWSACPDPIAIAGNNIDGAEGWAGKFYRAVMWSDLTQTTKVFDIEFIDANSSDPWTSWDDYARTGNWTASGGVYAQDAAPAPGYFVLG